MVIRMLIALLCGLAVASSVAIVPNHNSATTSEERAAIGNVFNHNFFARDDSKIRHVYTTLLSNAASKSDIASALSQPLPVVEHVYPFGETIVETLVPSVEKIFIDSTMPIEESIIEPIVSIEPVLPIVEQFNHFPVLPAVEQLLPHYAPPAIEPIIPYYAFEPVVSPLVAPPVETIAPYFGYPQLGIEVVAPYVGVPNVESVTPYFGIPAVGLTVPYYGLNYFTAIDKVPVGLYDQFSPYPVTYSGVKI